MTAPSTSDGAGVTHIDEVEVEAGASADLKVKLEKGNYVMICNIDTPTPHYMQGHARRIHCQLGCTLA